MQYLSHIGLHAYPAWSETLRDRSHVLIRPMEKGDSAAERKFTEALPSGAECFRVMGQIARPSSSAIERSPLVDYGAEMAFVAVAYPADGQERIVGVSRYRTATRGLKCEFVVTVSDAWREKALGTSLMRHLIEIARSEGFRSMYSIDAAGNTAMSDLAGSLGFRTRMDPYDDRQVIHELEL